MSIDIYNPALIIDLVTNNKLDLSEALDMYNTESVLINRSKDEVKINEFERIYDIWFYLVGMYRDNKISGDFEE